MSHPQTLTRWFQHTVATGDAASRGTPVALILLHILRDAAQILAYWAFAVVMANWVVDESAPLVTTITLMIASLTSVWLLQGATLVLHNRARLRLLSVLQERLLNTFAQRQHALIRTHSPFYWQTLWQQHIPALVNWQLDYRVQQIVAVIVPLLALITIFLVNLVVGASLLVTLPVVPLFMILVGKGAAALHRRHFLALERLGSLFVDRVSALPLLANLRAHDAQRSLLDEAGEQLRQRTMKVVSVAFLSTTVLDFFSTLAVALIAVFIGFSLLGEFQLGERINLQQGLWMLLTAPLLLSEMKRLGQFYHQKAQAEAAKEALGDLLSESDEREHKKAFSGLTLHGELSETPRLNANNLNFRPGQWVRLVGESGSGKTVVMELLSGQRSGLSETLSDYALLTQTPVILPGTVRENLCLDDTIGEPTLWSVLQRVGLDDWVSQLPHALDTPMGEHARLSGGQAQRLAIARLLLRASPVWLLDEPTAHLPEEQHQQISQLLHHCCQNATVIWASHKALPEHWFDVTWHVKDGEVA